MLIRAADRDAAVAVCGAGGFVNPDPATVLWPDAAALADGWVCFLPGA